MRKLRNNSYSPQKRTDRFTFLSILLIGIVILFITLHFCLSHGVKTTLATMQQNISDLKEQCRNYDDFSSADEAKSLVRLSEQAEDLAETLALLSEKEKQRYVNTFLDSQRLDCVLLLDGSMRPETQYDSGDMRYKDWKEVLSSSAVTTVLAHPKKIYTERLNLNGELYDIAAAAREDAEGIVFCAVLQDSAKLLQYYSSVQNLLTPNETSLNGTLYITEDGIIIASSQDYRRASASDIPELAALDAAEYRNQLTKITCNGKTYFGGSAMYRSYTLYAFYPANAIFADSLHTLPLILSLYIILSALLLSINYRNKRAHNREVNRQYEIIRSISHIYLLTLVVDVQKQQYTILKHPAGWDRSDRSGVIDRQFLRKLSGNVSEEFREGYLTFIDTATLPERLSTFGYVEYDYQDVSGEWFNDKIVPQEQDTAGNFHLYILVRMSIQEQKKAELENQQKLRAAAQREALANQAKTDFLHRMTHDVRTPINVILGMLEICDRNPDDAELLKSCRAKSKSAAEYLLELVNDILNVNKLDAADPTEHTEAFVLADEVQKLYLIAEERAKAADITLAPPTITGESLPLEGNPLYLRQIMMNIVNNAVRYSHSGGVVRFSVSEMPRAEAPGFAEVRFVCEDHGIGMTREFQQTMFEPFAQEMDTVISHSDGVGLGLSIVQKLVKKLGGTISVDSEKGVGTRFEIVLPYKYADAPTENAPTETDKFSLRGLTLLLAEDNKLNMEVANMLLTQAGATLIKAYNGKEALDCFASSAVGTIDVVLTDMFMPVMDGLEATKRIRALDRPDARTTPIIAMTASLFEEDREACMDAGMTGFLSKPLDMEQLIQTISQQIRKEQHT